MEIIFKDEKVVNTEGEVLLEYLNLSNEKLYEFLELLLLNEEKLELKLDSKVAISIKMHEIISLEFNKYDSEL